MKEGKVGTLSFLNIYSNIDIGIERTMCFIGYFHIQALEKGIHDHRQVTIERCVYLNDHPWNLSDVPIHRSTINILRGRMEDSMAPGFVDFANKRIHIHSIISSCTQEEVLFSCAPEAFLAMAICETLQDGEVVLVRNARRYTDYTGYLDTFRYNGFYGGDTVPSPPPRLLDILVLDAVYRDHFSIHNTTRDMSKAFIAFKAMRGIPIVTGHWGCGIFGGNKVHKFLQQLCAASEAACERLDYSGWSVGEVYRNLLRIDRREGVSDSVQFEQRIAAFMATEQ
ncbi:Poly glycohydrolase [Chytridium lagenaria]|nr:Poly glycohydrolase [Chytridium lagenaria]